MICGWKVFLSVFKRIDYAELNGRQQENYNFQKIAACLADYGFNCLRLTDDWEGADFIACHVDGSTILKVQLKGRAGFYKQYEGKQLYIAFQEGGETYLYPHDEVLQQWLDLGKIAGTDSWEEKGEFHYPRLTKELKSLLLPYRLS